MKKKVPAPAPAPVAPPKLTTEEKLAAAKVRTGTGSTAVAKVAKQLMLPFWPDTVRRTPNLVLRNSLFAATQKREIYGRPMRLLASLEGHTVKATERMNQLDLDNFEMLLHLQREHPVGARVKFSAHGFLTTMGRATGGSAHAKLHEDLTRLANVLVEIRWTKERKSYTGSLLAGFARDEETGLYVVSFNEDLLQLYQAGATDIQFEQRQQLGRNHLAKWLHANYSSHDAPYPMKLATIHLLSGSETKAIREFRRLLKTAMARLVDVGLLSSWTIDKDDLVSVKKTRNLR